MSKKSQYADPTYLIFGIKIINLPLFFNTFLISSTVITSSSLVGRCSKKLLAKTTSNLSLIFWARLTLLQATTCTSLAAYLRDSGLTSIAILFWALMLFINSQKPAPRSQIVSVVFMYFWKKSWQRTFQISLRILMSFSKRSL